MPVQFLDWGVSGTGLEVNLPQPVQAVLAACNANPSFELVEIRNFEKCLTRVIVVDVNDGSFGPRNEVGIRRKERLGLTYTEGKRYPWDVRALRADFPVTIHQNHIFSGEPRSLCLYAEPWSVVERTWTPERFLVRILWWLREAAEGRLHQPDQSIEQLFFTAQWKIILPFDHYEKAQDPGFWLELSSTSGSDNSTVLSAEFVDCSQEKSTNAVNFESIALVVSPLGNGPVEAFPHSLGELHDLLSARGSSLIDPLVAELKTYVPLQDIKKAEKGSRFSLVIVYMPRERSKGVEKFDVHGFVVPVSLGELGESCGALLKAPDDGTWYKDPRGLGQQANTSWRELSLDLVDIRTKLDKTRALGLSGIVSESSVVKGVLAGVGALGSSLANIWAREGWGEWDYVDPDIIEPHNIVRHLCSDNAVGFPKADVVKMLCDQLYPDGSVSSTQALAFGITDDNPDVKHILAGKDVLVDVTTMLDVPRDLGARDDVPRVASLFLTPSGMSSVMLLEDKSRAVRASSLESQYYRALLVNDSLGNAHLEGYARGVLVGGGCRDVTSLVPMELVQMHAALLARQLRLSIQNGAGRICVWSVDDLTGAIDAVEVPVSLPQSQSVSGWVVEWDSELTSRLQKLRSDSLPQETGGVLLGVIDQKLKTISLVLEVSSPLDSVSTLSTYSRGTDGLLGIIEECQRRTANMVSYIGEWHSHPVGVAAQPSAKDRMQLDYLSEAMACEGLPGLMLIVSDSSLGICIGDEVVEVVL